MIYSVKAPTFLASSVYFIWYVCSQPGTPAAFARILIT